jgi:mannose/fructose/N-acetylgalactosamine-specific phosphotransferase system component IID
MYLVAVGWMYVVVMMSVAEAVSTQGTVMGAVITFVLYGLLPMSIVLYVMGSPLRRRKRLASEAQAEAEATAQSASSSAAPDAGSLPAGDAVAPEREKV